MGKKVILAGGSGFIGTLLARRLQRESFEVVVLTRHPPAPRTDGIVEAQWPARPLLGSNPTSYRTHGTWVQAIDGADAIVNLTGRSINCVHTPKNRRQITDSRLDSVRVLGAALEQCRQLPAVWVQASAVGYYGSRALPACDEESAAGATFLADVCAKWEAGFAATCPASVRPVVLRFAMVLGREGGAVPPLARITRCFLGGPAGNGKQGISWIHQEDLMQLFLAAITREAMRGTYNASAPDPVSNAEFMRTLRQVLGRPWCPAAPAPVIRLVAKFILRTEPSLILDGQFVIPGRLLAEGHQFKYAQISAALRYLAGRAIR